MSLDILPNSEEDPQTLAENFKVTGIFSAAKGEQDRMQMDDLPISISWTIDSDGE